MKRINWDQTKSWLILFLYFTFYSYTSQSRALQVFKLQDFENLLIEKVCTNIVTALPTYRSQTYIEFNRLYYHPKARRAIQKICNSCLTCAASRNAEHKNVPKKSNVSQSMQLAEDGGGTEYKAPRTLARGTVRYYR